MIGSHHSPCCEKTQTQKLEIELRFSINGSAHKHKSRFCRDFRVNRAHAISDSKNIGYKVQTAIQ